MVHAQTAFLVVGLLFVALPATTWTILYRRHNRAAVALWCGGSLLYGIGFILVGLRETVPAWLSFVVANPMSFAAYALRGMALRRELGARRSDVAAHLGAWAFASLAYIAAWSWSSIEAPRLFVALVVNIVGAGWIARVAWLLHRERGFRSAALLAYTYGLFALALMVRLAGVLLDWNAARAFSGSLDFALTLLTAVIAALYGNLGYIGIALETARDRELARTEELAREHERHMQAQVRVDEQAALLLERGVLLAQREEMLAVLAHEVRQPLNNASAALQSAADAIGSAQSDRDAASARLQRASAVVSRITASLDNTLADAVLLAGDEAAVRQDVDISLVLELAIGDLEPNERERVRIERETDARTASMNAGLIRLALRNLIANALAYSPHGSPVTVRVAELDDPLALVFEVVDSGPGIEPALRRALFTRGASGAQIAQRPGHGLGLYIVRRIARLHGGDATVRPNEPHGSAFSLVIPQGVH